MVKQYFYALSHGHTLTCLTNSTYTRDCRELPVSGCKLYDTGYIWAVSAEVCALRLPSFQLFARSPQRKYCECNFQSSYTAKLMLRFSKVCKGAWLWEDLRLRCELVYDVIVVTIPSQIYRLMSSTISSYFLPLCCVLKSFCNAWFLNRSEYACTASAVNEKWHKVLHWTSRKLAKTIAIKRNGRKPEFKETS